MGRPRKDRERKTQNTRQQLVWDFLMAEGPKSEREIAAFYGGSHRGARDVIAKLKHKGVLRHIGSVSWGRYEAVGQRPIDGRGHAVNSTRALNQLNKAAKAQKQAKVPKAKVYYSSFAQSLAWFCRDSRVDNQPDIRDNLRREVTSSETVEAA